MIVPGQHLRKVYEAIKKDSNGSEDQSVLCLAASVDADSVCASQLLLNLFNRESIHFSLVPVACYEEEVKTVLLLNCGATEDVRSLCNLPSNVRIVVLDHHRPVWHGHNNDDDMDTLVLVDDDDPVPKPAVPSYDQQLDNEVAQSDDSASESDGSDLDDVNDDDNEEGVGSDGEQTRKRHRGHDAGVSPPKRGPAARAENVAARRKRAEEVDAYYSDRNGYGKPSSLLLFSLCHELQHDDNFHVWCAIVALTEQLLFQQISKQQYNTWRDKLAVHVTMHHDQDQEDAAQDGISSLLSMPRHKVHVEACEDLRLTLLRYWTIEDSLRYTCYVAARLQTWRQKGLDNLRSLLTYMCIPLKHASTAYKGLREVYNGQLRSQLPRFAPQHMLAWDSLHFNSFRLLYKHEELGASDMVFALLGLLTEAEPGNPDSQRTAFNNAQSALHVQRNLHIVERGVELAKQMCQDVVHECGLMITAGKVKGGRSADYRWVNVADSNALANPRFRHPTVLKYMALFLRDATSCRYSSSDARRPMVVAGAADERGLCCLVSVHAKHISGNRLQNNPFARPFIETASALNIVPLKSAFENATYHIRKEDVTAFLGKLQDVVADYRAVAQQAQAVQG
ncbi:hypothetical protein VOLCADRAFT_115803 [Volvox carteri f. nagariensis]|uniref:Cell division control protein 45 n=1 Tax=Volvox carteri f. nagariensis TaxID=3068 RepID=D8TID6_VOLCA|nr:uncharacterized protein VOLCADRAFT_115803 [Volvox carteri f. nagariensis]EFJ53221.1 hypothetical protein VOLCADRAFT_115803 [Volvox carteri f. nagariensis]|eukprot:XP_002946226.1 hypothetical protein VOLCADRAFT_115803 [Volvox carteri f. nagariensis]